MRRRPTGFPPLYLLAGVRCDEVQDGSGLERPPADRRARHAVEPDDGMLAAKEVAERDTAPSLVLFAPQKDGGACMSDAAQPVSGSRETQERRVERQLSADDG